MVSGSLLASPMAAGRFHAWHKAGILAISNFSTGYQQVEIQGPIKIGVLNDPETAGWELQMNFTDDFKSADLEQQGQIFAAYLADLAREINGGDADDANRAGMLIVQQIGEQLLPHIQAGEIALEETMIVEIGREQAFSLTDLING